jgi:hypothetical protein
VAAACAEWAEAPSVHLHGDFEGVLDVVAIIDESLDELPDDRRQLRPLRQRLADRLDGMRRAVLTIKEQPEMASIRTINLSVLSGEIRKLRPFRNPGRLGGKARSHLRSACPRFPCRRSHGRGIADPSAQIAGKGAPLRVRNGFLVPDA